MFSGSVLSGRVVLIWDLELDFIAPEDSVLRSGLFSNGFAFSGLGLRDVLFKPLRMVELESA